MSKRTGKEINAVFKGANPKQCVRCVSQDLYCKGKDDDERVTICCTICPDKVDGHCLNACYRLNENNGQPCWMFPDKYEKADT